MSKNILDIDDDGGDVLFDEEEKSPEVVPVIGKKIQSDKKPEDFGFLEQLTPKGEEMFSIIVTMLSEMSAPHFAVVVDREKSMIRFERVVIPEEPELSGEEKIDLIYQITKRQMQELDELRQHVFTIEKKVTQRCSIMNLLSNMKKFILGGSNGRI